MPESLNNDQIFIRRLTEIIHANMTVEDFGVEELAHELGMSPYRINRRLYSINKKTCNQFIKDVRLEKAYELLQDETYTVAEVANKTGFGSSNYFNKCFHEYFGYTPGSVKKSDHDKNENLNPVNAADSQKQKRHFLRTFVLITSGILLLAVISYLGYNIFFKKSSADADNLAKYPGKSIAVLPFRNLSDSSANQYFIDGIMEEILTDLSRIHELSVLSRTSVEQFRESTISSAEIAKKLNVDYILEGSGQKAGNGLRLRVQLIDAVKDKHIWAESYEKEIYSTKDIFMIQNQIAQSIVTELKATITPEEKELIEKIPTLNLTAYDFWQRGMSELNKFDYPEYNAKANRKAATLFYKALEYDSTLAGAYIGLACTYQLRTERDPAILNNELFVDYLDSMIYMINKALSYDNEFISGHYLRGIYYASIGDKKQAIEESEKAIRLDPGLSAPYVVSGYCQDNMVKSLECLEKAAGLEHGLSRAHFFRNLGDQYFEAGFPEQGNYYFMEALKLDGDTVAFSVQSVETATRVNGDYRKGLVYYEKSYLEDTSDVSNFLNLGYYYAIAGRYKESLKFYKKYLSGKESYEHYKLSINQRIWMEYLLIYVYIQNGGRKEADFLADKIIEVNNGYMKSYPYLVDHYTLACVYATRGDNAKAYKNLRIFNQNGIYYLSRVIKLKNDPFFNNIRNEPEFQRIVKDIESKYQAEHERVRKWLEEKGMLQ